MIIFKDVSKIYKMGDIELRVLDHANMHIREGEFVSIIGPSGSGKSTLMNKVGLWDRRKHKPTELSGGQQQRVAIARALATRPSIFLADEPTGNLDSRTGRDIMEIFHELHEAGNTIVLITHDGHVASQAARSLKILDGHVDDIKDIHEIEEVVRCCFSRSGWRGVLFAPIRCGHF